MSKSILEQYREMQEQMSALSSQLQALEKNPELEKTKGLIDELNALVKNSGLSAENAVFAVCEVFGKRKVAALVGAGGEAAPVKAERKKRQAMTYTHPNTGKQITARKLHGELLRWKEEFGLEALKPTPAE